MKSPVRKGFNRLSGVYDGLLWCTFGNSVLQSQTTLLPALPPCKRVLMIGGGTGSFLIEFLKQKSPSEIVYLDISEGMIRRTKAKIQAQFPSLFSSIRFVCADVKALNADEKFDLVITNYVLDLFAPNELRDLAERICTHLTPSGIWYVSDFSYSENPTWLQRILHRMLYRFFRIVCKISADDIPDLKSEMKHNGMVLRQEVYSLRKLLWSGIYEKQD